MSKHSLVTGIPQIPRVKIPKHSRTRSTRPLEIIHTDLCGPVHSSSALKYIVTFIDDYSRFTWVYFLSRKSETFEKFKTFKLMVENQLHCRITCLRSDRGGEYMSTEFQNFCTQAGIRRQLTVANAPHQNGIAERKNRTLLEAARSILISSDIPTNLWTESIRTANYIQNRSGTKALHNITPFEALHQVKPDVKHLRVIGCQAYVLLPDSLQSKLGVKAIPTTLLGYDDQSKAYRCLDVGRHRILISKDVAFD